MFRSAQHDNGRIEIARCLGVLFLQIIGRDLEGVAVGIAEINRVGNFVILEFEFDVAIFEFALRREKILPVRAEREMKHPKTAVTRRR
jgi:hypothetical protein